MATVTYSNKVSGPTAQTAFVKLLNQNYPNARRMERIPWWASILSIQSIYYVDFENGPNWYTARWYVRKNSIKFKLTVDSDGFVFNAKHAKDEIKKFNRLMSQFMN